MWWWWVSDKWYGILYGNIEPFSCSMVPFCVSFWLDTYYIILFSFFLGKTLDKGSSFLCDTVGRAFPTRFLLLTFRCNSWPHSRAICCLWKSELRSAFPLALFFLLLFHLVFFSSFCVINSIGRIMSTILYNIIKSCLNLIYCSELSRVYDRSQGRCLRDYSTHDLVISLMAWEENCFSAFQKI